MRVPSPQSSRLERRALLRDVVARLQDRLPRMADGGVDPSNPAWMLLGEAAWMVEQLSEQLDRYPLASVQRLIHLMGGRLRAATPSLGVVVIEVAAPGQLRSGANADTVRFFTRRTETDDAREFISVEPEVSLLPARIESLCLQQDGLLSSLGGEPMVGESGVVAWAQPPRRSTAFDVERIEYVVSTANPTATAAALDEAIRQIADRRIGWLSLYRPSVESGRTSIVAEISPAHALTPVAPGGLWMGGDVEADWGGLPDDPWRPPVRVAADPRLPRRLHGQLPLPTADDGWLLIPDVPPGFPLARLLDRAPAPVPTPTVEAIWRLIADAGKAELGLLRHVIIHSVGGQSPPPEARWIDAALAAGGWSRVARRGRSTVGHLRLLQPQAGAGLLRVGIVTSHEQAVAPTCYPLGDDDAFGVAPLHAAHRWSLPAPAPSGAAIWTVHAYDVSLPEDARGIVLTVDADMRGLLVNPVLVANMPAVRDGRQWTVQRSVPEPVSLLFGDLITPEVIEQTLEHPIPDAAAALLRGLPQAGLLVEGQDGPLPPVVSWAGVGVEAGEGRVVLNAPDGHGEQRALRPGTRVRLDWYRRTDGEAGRVGPGAIALVEQEASARLRVTRVSNPLGTVFGEAREAPDAAVERLFGPTGGPALASDLERLFRQALGARARGWALRCWTYAERTLVSTALWPLTPEPIDPDEERVALTEALATAGPDTLVVAVGPLDRAMEADELVWARSIIQHSARTLRDRAPAVRGAIVARMWPLTLHLEEASDPSPSRLPCWETLGLRGSLVDARGRAAAAPSSRLLLNAAITSVEVEP